MRGVIMSKKNLSIDSTTEYKIYEMLNLDPANILLLKNKYVTEDLWRFCIEKEPRLFKKVKNPSLELCISAIEADGSNLKVIKKKFPRIKITKQMAYIAISNCPRVILDVPDDIIDDGLKEYAFDRDPTLLSAFSDVRNSYIEKKLAENPSFIRYIYEPSESQICEMIKINPNVCLYFGKLTDAMKNTIKTYYPHMVDLIPAMKN